MVFGGSQNRLDFFIFLVGGLVLNSNFSKCLLIWFADCRATSHDTILTCIWSFVESPQM